MSLGLGKGTFFGCRRHQLNFCRPSILSRPPHQHLQRRGPANPYCACRNKSVFGTSKYTPTEESRKGNRISTDYGGNDPQRRHRKDQVVDPAHRLRHKLLRKPFSEQLEKPVFYCINHRLLLRGGVVD